MPCILQPGCNFLHGYFRSRLIIEMVDVEVKVVSMQGIHKFKRDRTCQIIRCNTLEHQTLSISLLICKMKRYLELKGKLGPKPKSKPQVQPQQLLPRPSQPSANPRVRKAQGIKTKGSEKRKKNVTKPTGGTR